MNDIWKLITDPKTDPVLLRVFRWLMQWPEALATATMLDVGEITRATGLTEEAIDGALGQLVGRGCIELYAASPREGLRWFTMRLNGDRSDLAAPFVARPRSPKVPREQLRAISVALRWTVLERDGRRCRACGTSVDDGARLVIDHITPFSKGGLTTEENLQVLCHDCNAGKSDRVPSETES